MFTELWFDIADYPESHQATLKKELEIELHLGHILFGRSLGVISKREDDDDILVKSSFGYIVVHLTWWGKTKFGSFPALV